MFGSFSFGVLFLSALSAFASPQSQLSPVIAIASGSPSASGAFVADTDFSGGSPYLTSIPIDTSHVTNPAPVGVYDNCRYGNFTYSIPGLAAGASYLVRLHFADNYFNSPGARIFNVAINGTQVMTNFDIVATTGGEGIANIQQFQAIADGNGRITILFTSVVNNSMVNGIEILNAGSLPIPTPTPSYNLSLTSNSASYAAGAKATVVATLSNAPLDPDSDFYVSATFLNSAIPLTPITKNQSYAITQALPIGSSNFTATVFLENSSEVAALKHAIRFYQENIAKWTADLAVTTDPNAIATLNAKIAHDQDRLAATIVELSSVRKPIGSPVNLTISAH